MIGELPDAASEKEPEPLFVNDKVRLIQEGHRVVTEAAMQAIQRAER